MKELISREVRVALSKRAQPIWFRVLKWVVFLAVSAILWNTGYLGWGLIGALILSLTVHFVWRWQTKGWTQPWGGWNDVEAAQRH